MLHLNLNKSKAFSKESVSFFLSGSKSISQRALIINYLLDIIDMPDNISDSEDTALLYQALCSKKDKFNLKQSGTAFRFLLSLFSLKSKSCVLTGDTRLLERPIRLLIESLQFMGADILWLKDKVIINKSSLIGKEIHFPILKTSQFITSLLLIGPYIKNGLKLNFSKNTYSKSYIDLTTNMMLQCGANLKLDNNSITVFEGQYTQKIHVIESDWTSASYLFLSFLFSEYDTITMSTLNQNSIQPDSHICDFFSLVGVMSQFHNDKLTLKKIKSINNPIKIHWDFCNNPDLFPTILIACFGLGIELVANGIHTLFYKESNRIDAMKKELSKFNCVFNVMSDDTIYFKPKKKSSKNYLYTIETYNDHRIALAFSPLVLLGFRLKIKNFHVINKSYPSFFHDLIKFGVEIKKTKR